MKTILAILFMLCGAACFSAEGDTASPVKVSVLLEKDFPADTGNQGRMMTVEFSPGNDSKPHSHPGAIYAYVLEGTMVSAIDNEPEKTYKVGEFWYEPPGCTHRVSRNPSQTEKAKLLVFFVTQPGKPVVVAPDHH